MAKKNLRRYNRIAFSTPIRIAWQDDSGADQFARGTCLDVSESGLRIETSDLIPARAVIMFRAERLDLSGSATVRYSSRRGMKFILGLELSQRLRELAISIASERSNPASSLK